MAINYEKYPVSDFGQQARGQTVLCLCLLSSGLGLLVMSQLLLNLLMWYFRWMQLPDTVKYLSPPLSHFTGGFKYRHWIYGTDCFIQTNNEQLSNDNFNILALYLLKEFSNITRSILSECLVYKGTNIMVTLAKSNSLIK